VSYIVRIDISECRVLMEAAAAVGKTHIEACICADETKSGVKITNHIFFKGKKLGMTTKDVAFDDLPESLKRALAKENALQELSAKEDASEDASEDEELSVEIKARCAEVAALEKAVSTMLSVGLAAVKHKKRPMTPSEKLKETTAKVQVFNKGISINSAGTSMTLSEKVKETTAKVQAFNKESTSTSMILTETMKDMIAKVQAINKEMSINRAGTSIAKGRAPVPKIVSVSKVVEAGSATEDNGGKTVAPVAKML
jgi:hypothetical protein